MLMRVFWGMSFIFFSLSGAVCQSSPTVRGFEVASIRLRQSPAHNIGISTSGLRLNAEAESVLGLIMYAYGLRKNQVSMPSLPWLEGASFDIAARAEGDGVPTNGEFRQMLQRLLAERFQLRIHREMREMPVYALVVGKSGPKFKESAPDVDGKGRINVNGRNCQVTLPKATMEDLIDEVANSLPGRPVVDRTGLTGTYGIQFTYTMNSRANRETPDLGDITIFSAVENQLGLRLVAQKELIEVLVVDDVQKPSEN
jgi:uncharacterized protein (TIGR03435 family)